MLEKLSKTASTIKTKSQTITVKGKKHSDHKKMYFERMIYTIPNIKLCEMQLQSYLEGKL